jgi:hypothetical protein
MKNKRWINTRVEIDMLTGRVEKKEGFWHDGPVAECAISIAVVRQGVFTAEFSVTATADADVGPTNVAHGLKTTPQRCNIQRILAVLDSGATCVPGATNLVFTKLSTVGSGNASPQWQLNAEAQHSLVQ